jgi:hypothetical protein
MGTIVIIPGPDGIVRDDYLAYIRRMTGTIRISRLR